MKFKKLGLFVGGALALACSSGDLGNGHDDTAEATGTTEDGIIRSTSLGGRNEVVMLLVKYVASNGGIGTRGCSGSYFAPRVVLTAAHCLEGAWANQVFVYFGDNYEADKGELVPLGDTLVPPPPGSPSHFAQADSWEQHPNWDNYLNAPDMGVVYLDRKPPFDPLPLFRNRLDNSWNGKTVTISGWGYGQATGPVSGTGGQIQRTGKQKIIGTPTAADYHEDDPNPGMLDPAIRQQVVKMDGRAPNSNGCFGDSGSPIIVNQYGQDYIAGVDYWGGYYCEDYSLYFRIDPFLPFLDNSYKKGGQETLIPKFVCQAPNPSGSRTAYFGYENKNGVALTVPYGTKNTAGTLDTKGWRNKYFRPGKVDTSFAIDFGTTQTLTYSLTPDNSPKTTLTVTKNSTACTSTDLVEAGNYCRAAASSGCPNLPPFSDCLEGTISFNNDFNAYVPDCKDELTAYNVCTANVPAGTSNWVCQDGYYPYAPSCDDEFNTWLVCAGFI